MGERGVIYNRAYASQLRDFSGLRWGNITPTDIDGLVDFGAKAFVVLEIKHRGGNMPLGQRIAMERLIDNLALSGVDAIGLVAEHNTNGDIDCANCIVTEFRWRQCWYQDERQKTVRAAIEGFLKTVGLDRYLSPTTKKTEDMS